MHGYWLWGKCLSCCTLAAIPIVYTSFRMYWLFHTFYLAPSTCPAAFVIAVMPLERMHRGHCTALPYHCGHLRVAWLTGQRVEVHKHAGSQEAAETDLLPVARSDVLGVHCDQGDAPTRSIPAPSPKITFVADDLLTSRQSTSHL
jgi:hypothetical protein